MTLNFKRSFPLIGILCFVLTVNFKSHAQGCVAIRGFSSCNGNIINGGSNLMKGDFSVGTNIRYFESFRHFRGSHEETHRIEEGTQVINDSYFVDIAFNYAISERVYATFLLPFVSHVRSSMYEHGGNPPNGLGERHNTRSSGLSDIRIGLGYWLFKPNTKSFNYALGAGIKLPTGDYSYMDTFYNQGPNRDRDELAVVDQSIQPGDGGLGFNIDFQGYQMLSDSFTLTTSLYYLFNPEETNGVLTRGGRSEFSVPDQYAALLGALYFPKIKGVSFYLGGRIEGVPSSDLIGGSGGYRRPGYAISVDPGINYNTHNLSLSLNVPVAVERNRTQSFLDKQRTEETGVYRHGDAAFADYLINFNLTYRFRNKKSAMSHDMEDGSVDFNTIN
ncbi:transporter [Flavobacteriaceae bacterium XHP0103]|uniref:transporter n=1 Tax=Marixanthotalea marina TaxID=2844359 RepID=UPI002989B7ED|nr:transporter [Marixanthotalea marina]MBU3821107.1 transporter [Marixanthotalea marina]